MTYFTGSKEGKLIEVKTFWLTDLTVSPGSPISFDDSVDFHHLPNGYTYKVEIIQAHYIP